MIPPSDEPPPERELFPLAADRGVIQAFLAGRKIYIDKTATLNTHGGELKYEHVIIAWFDKITGALIGHLPPGMATQASRRVLEYLTQTLGTPTTVTRERRDNSPSSWFYGDQPIEINIPFVIAGPLSVLAYRASLEPTPPKFKQPKT